MAVSKIKIKQLQSGNQPFGQVIKSDGSGNTIWSYPIEIGTTFPSSPTGGTLYYRSDEDALFHYDETRTKWLSVTTNTFTCGRGSLSGNVGGYFGIADTVFSSTEGFYMPRNGTVLGMSVDNANVITRTIQLRINNSAANRIDADLVSSKSVIVDNTNLDFSSGDIIQVGALPNGIINGLSNVTVIFEVAWRV